MSPKADADPFDEVADELYSLAPEDFTAARNKAEKQARSAGDRDLAARIRRLGKPSTVAWLANQLVRQQPQEIGPLLELGSDLRDATARLSGDKLRELTRLQHQVVAGLMAQGQQIAKAAGHRVSDDAMRALEETLRAALADEDLAAQLQSGRLTGALEHVGFAGSPSTPETAPPVEPARPRQAASPDHAERQRLMETAERELRRAQDASDAAAETAAKAQSELADASTAVRAKKAETERLSAELGHARRAQEAAQKAEEKARSAAERAARVAKEKRRELQEAQTKRDRLGGRNRSGT